jgi:hypothetical protein
MSIVDRINSQTMQMGASAKLGIQNFFLLSCKVISGLILGLTFSLVGQEVFHYGPVLFGFAIVAITSVFYKLSKSWGSIGLLIFDLLCILAALLVRMYIVVAPG